MNTRFFYLNTDYLRSRFSPAPFLRTKKQTLLLQRLFGGEEVIRSFASIAVPGISLRRMLLGLCRPLPLDFSPFSRPRRRSKSRLKRLEFLSPGTRFFRPFSFFFLEGRQPDCISKNFESFSVTGAGSFYGADFRHNDKETEVNTVVFTRFLRKSGRKSVRQNR